MLRPLPNTPEIMTSCKRQHGLTLIELLTVIAIIGLLVRILIPVAAKVRATADSVACTSNLRQIGIANLSYVSEHQGNLPGGLHLFQGAWGNKASSGMLAAFLAPYMDEDFGTSWTNSQVESFVCPAWRRVATVNASGGLTQALYHMNPAKINDTGLDAWQGSGNSRVDPNTHTMDQVRGKDAAGTWMLVELDRQSPFSGVGSSSVVAKPVHGTFRHKLYLDGHVVSEPIE